MLIIIKNSNDTLLSLGMVVGDNPCDKNNFRKAQNLSDEIINTWEDKFATPVHCTFFQSISSRSPSTTRE